MARSTGLWLLVLLIIGTLTACGNDTTQQPEIKKNQPAQAPQAVDVTAGDAQIQLLWKPAPDAVAYTIYWSTRDNVSPANGQPIKVSTSSYIHNGLANDVAYFYVVTVTTGAGESSPSAVVSAMPRLSQPEMVTGVSVKPGDKRNTISWEPVNGATSYSVFWNSGDDAVVTGSDNRIDLINSPFVHTGLDNNVAYHYAVIALNNDRESELSSVQSATPVMRAPTAPIDIHVSYANGQAVITWRDVGNATQFDLYWNHTGNVSTADQHLGKVSSPFTHTPLKSDATYYYILTAANSAGGSAGSVEFSVNTGTGEIVIPDSRPQPAVPEFTSIAINDRQLTLDWDATDSDIKGYNIYWKAGDRNVTLADNKITNVIPPYTHVGLANGTPVFYTITAINDNGESAPAGVLFSSPQVIIPGVPANLAAAAGDGEITVSWNLVQGAHYYNLYWGAADSDNEQLIGDVQPPVVIPALTNGQKYRVAVSANNPGGESARSKAIDVTPHMPLPASPGGLSINPGNGQVRLSWDAPSGSVESYRIYWSTDPLFTKSTANSIDVQTTSYLHKERVNGQAYYYRIAAINAGGEGPFSKSVGGIPNPLVAGAPENLSMTPGDSQAVFVWDTDDEAAKYNLYWWQESGQSASQTDALAVSHSTMNAKTLVTSQAITARKNVLPNINPPYTLDGLNDNVTYHAYVSRVFENSESVFSTEIIFTPHMALPGDAALTGAVPGDGQVTLDWATVAGAQAYNLYWSTRPEIDFDNSAVIRATGPGYSHTGLTNGATYYYALTAVNSGGESALSTPVAAMPHMVPPVSPSGINVINGDGEITIDWPPLPAAQSYSLYWSATAGDDFTVWPRVAGFKPGDTLQELHNGQNYSLVLTAINSGGESAPSGRLYAVPQPAAPAAPTGIAATGSDAQVSVGWDALPGLSYNLYWSLQPGVRPGSPGVTKISAVSARYAHLSLNNNVTYYYAVTAVNSGGESAPSEQTQATPHAIAPETPLGLYAVGADGAVTLHWQGTDSANATYTLYRSTSADVSPINGSAIANVTSPFVDNGLSNGTRYYYVVTATASAESAPSPVATAVPQVAPVGPPVGVQASATVGSDQITVNWKPNSDPLVTYNVYWSSSPGVTPASGNVVADQTPPFFHTDHGANVTLYYVVTAVNAAGESAPSAEASATPGAPDNSTPVITQGATVQRTMAEDGIFTTLALDAVDNDADALTWLITSSPANGSASVTGLGNTAEVNYQPEPNFNGQVSFVVSVDDGNGGRGSITVNVTVQPQNDPPAIDQGDATIVNMDEDGSPMAFVLSLSASDIDNDVLQWSVAPGAMHGTADVTGSGSTIAVVYDPDADYFGSDNFTVNVNDGNGGTDSFVVTVTIAPQNDAPTIASPLADQQVTEDVAFTYTFANDAFTDVDGDALSYSAVQLNSTTLPAWLSFDPTLRTFSGTPAQQSQSSWTIVVTADDGNNGLVSDTFIIGFTAVNGAPVIQGPVDPIVMDEDGVPTAFALTLSATDEEGDPLTWNIPPANGPANGVATLGAPSPINLGQSMPVNYVPDPDFNGTDSFQVTVSDTNGASGSYIVNVIVNPRNDAPVISGQNPLTTPEDTALTIMLADLTVDDVDNTYPGGFTLSVQNNPASNYTVTGNTILPNANFNGSLSVPVTVNDGSADSVVFNVVVQVTPVNDVPEVLNPIGDQQATEGVAFSFTFAANTFRDLDGDTLSYSAVLTGGGPLPVWLAFDTGSRTFSGTPPQQSEPSWSIVVTADDGHNGLVSDTFIIGYTAVNGAPVIQGPPEPTVMDEDGTPTAFALTLSATDEEGDPLTWNIPSANGPSHGVASLGTPSPINLGESIPVNYVPNPDYNGTDSFAVTVADSNAASATFIVDVTINPQNDAPEITGQTPLSTAEDTALTITLTDLVVTDVDNTYPTGFALNVLDGSDANYTRVGNTITPFADYTGSLIVPVTVNDGAADSAEFQLSVQVSAVNDAPRLSVPIADQAATEDVNFAFTFAADTFVDVDGDALSYTAVLAGSQSLPAWLAFDAGSRTFSGLPVNQDTGPWDIVITASDGGSSGSASDTFVINVAAVNDAPQIQGPANPIVMDEDGTPTAFALTLSATDEEGDPLAWSIPTASGPSHGNATLGTPSPINLGESIPVNYVPTTDYNGADNFAVTVSDSNGGTATYLVEVVINAQNDAPEITGQNPLSTEEDTALTITLADVIVTDVDNTYPTGFTLSVLDGSDVNYTRAGNTISPVADYTGSLTVPVTVNDGLTDSSVFELTVQVSPVNDSPQINTQPATTQVAVSTRYTYNITATDVDDPPGNLSFSAVGVLPTWLTLTNHADGSATLSGVPEVSNLGSYDITLQVADSAGATDQQSITLIVIEGLTDANQSTAVIQASAVAGNTVTIDIFARDTFGNDKQTGGDLFYIAISGANPAVQFLATDNGDGSYSASYTPTVTGSDSLSLTLNQTDAIGGSPYRVNVNPAATSAQDSTATVPASGQTGTAVVMTIQAKDRFGNNRVTGNDSVGFDVVGYSAVPTIVDNNNGTYTVSYVPNIIGTHTIDLLLNGSSISGSPFTINISRGDIAIAEIPFNSKILRDCVLNYAASQSTPWIMASEVTGTLDCSNRDISDLTGIEYLINLTGLGLNQNPILDLGPVSELQSLTGLSLDNSSLSANIKLSDITPLAGLKNLTRLALGGNQIADIRALAELPLLSVLYINSNLITDISYLANLPLTALLLDNNQISDIGPLMSIPELQALSISNNPLADIAVLGNPGSFSALTILVMDNVGLSNQEFTVMLSNQFPNLKALSISNNSYCGILACFRLSILDPLKVMPNLTELRAESNSITNLTPLSSVQSLQRLSLSGNGVTTASLDIFTTVSFPALNYFDLSNNKITNVLPLASMGSKVAMSLNLFANQIDTYIGNIDQLGKLQPGSTVDLRSNPNMSCDELDVLNKIFSGANPPSSVLPYPYVVNQDCRIPII